MMSSDKARLTVLTFNWHEPYIHMLAKTGHEFFVASPSLNGGSARVWDERARPVPSNARLIDMDTAFSGDYDVAVCHNLIDMAALADFDIPKILVFHNKLSTELALGGGTVKREDYLANVAPLMEKAAVKVFVSESKKDDWGVADGVVIKPGMDGDEFFAFDGSVKKILRVGNRIRERGRMLGFYKQEEICRGFECVIVGDNPSIGGAAPAVGWDDLRRQYSIHRVYLNATIAPFEDGYNMSMLEAMATGTPVVSVENYTSPITDGLNGYMNRDMDYLRLKIEELMEDHELASIIGARGKEMALSVFGIREFVDNWENAFESAMGSARR